ncbi:hypothetical protein G6F46_015241 [Rhizopus delemar]|nr:hypothetical protein G6F46_015241 [Rhizopus delemar]
MAKGHGPRERRQKRQTRQQGREQQIHAMRGCNLQSRGTLDSSRVAQQQPSVARLYIAPAQPNAARWAM